MAKFSFAFAVLRAFAVCLISIASANAVDTDLNKKPIPATVSFSIADYLPDAEVGMDQLAFDFTSQDSSTKLSSGWNEIVDGEPGPSGRWSKGRNSIVDLQLVQNNDITITLSVRSLPKTTDFPVQQIQIRWNDNVIGEFEIGWDQEEINFQVPKSIQHVGPNRVEILPRYWVDPRAASLSESLDRIAFKALKLFGSPASTSSVISKTASCPCRWRNCSVLRNSLYRVF